MQKWDYKIVLRSRGFKEVPKTHAHKLVEWETHMEDDSWQTLDDFEKYLTELGEQGWELVSVVAELGLGGFTNTEKWVFKRPKP